MKSSLKSWVKTAFMEDVDLHVEDLRRQEYILLSLLPRMGY